MCSERGQLGSSPTQLGLTLLLLGAPPTIIPCLTAFYLAPLPWRRALPQRLQDFHGHWLQ